MEPRPLTTATIPRAPAHVTRSRGHRRPSVHTCPCATTPTYLLPTCYLPATDLPAISSRPSSSVLCLRSAVFGPPSSVCCLECSGTGLGLRFLMSWFCWKGAPYPVPEA